MIGISSIDNIVYKKQKHHKLTQCTKACQYRSRINWKQTLYLYVDWVSPLCVLQLPNFQKHTLNIILQIVIPLSWFLTMNAKDPTKKIKSIEKLHLYLEVLYYFFHSLLCFHCVVQLLWNLNGKLILQSTLQHKI
jgi:hypothetical protein